MASTNDYFLLRFDVPIHPVENYNIRHMNRTMSGRDALRMMRHVSRQPDGHFTLVHIRVDMEKRVDKGMRKVERCRLRKALPDNTFRIDSDHYLPYEDMDTGEAKMCFKVLCRYVAFAPKYEWIKINWFDK